MTEEFGGFKKFDRETVLSVTINEVKRLLMEDGLAQHFGGSIESTHDFWKQSADINSMYGTQMRELRSALVVADTTAIQYPGLFDYATSCFNPISHDSTRILLGSLLLARMTDRASGRVELMLDPVKESAEMVKELGFAGNFSREVSKITYDVALQGVLEGRLRMHHRKEG